MKFSVRFGRLEEVTHLLYNQLFTITVKCSTNVSPVRYVMGMTPCYDGVMTWVFIAVKISFNHYQIPY